jgi:hypothetical protein
LNGYSRLIDFNEQIGQRNAQSFRQAVQHVYGRVGFAAFNAAKVRPVDTCIERQPFLRDAVSNANPPDINGNKFAPTHERMDNFYRQLNHCLYPSYIAVLSGGSTEFGSSRSLSMGAYEGIITMLPLRVLTKTATALLGVALIGGQTQAAAPLAFDLICSSKDGRNLHFRFDVQQRKWCIGECQAAWGINNVYEGSIRIVTYSKAQDPDWEITINRYTSTFSAVHLGYGYQPVDGGPCRAQPFSGFPDRKF